MRTVEASRQADDHAAGTLVPIRSSEACKCRDNVTAGAVRNGFRKHLALTGLFEDIQLIAKPLNRRSGHKHAALQRIENMIFKADRNCCDKAVFAHNRSFARVHQEEATRPVGVLHITRVDAALAEQRSLLVARSTGNRDFTAIKLKLRLSVDAA